MGLDDKENYTTDIKERDIMGDIMGDIMEDFIWIHIQGEGREGRRERSKESSEPRAKRAKSQASKKRISLCDTCCIDVQSLVRYLPTRTAPPSSTLSIIAQPF